MLLIEANHGQSIERRIFISRPVETTDQDKYANKIFKNDWFIDIEVGKLCLSYLLGACCNFWKNVRVLCNVFPDKNQKPLRMCRMQITNQAVAM